MTPQHVTISRDEYDALLRDAEAWRDVLAYAERSRFRQTSSAISAAADWRRIAERPSYARLEQRRLTYTTPALSPAEIKARAAASWAAVEGKRGAA